MFLLISLVLPAGGQSTQMEFGQNRVQYHEFFWSMYESENFLTYYYPGGQDIGRFSVKVAEDLLLEVEEMLDYRINKKINILVYNDITDLGMTNIGLERESYNAGGTTRILENKMFVYFDGDHQNLYNSIKEGIATILIDAMMFGGSFVEILQNAVLLNLPEWYKSGLAAYIGEEWSVEEDNELRKLFLSRSANDFNSLAMQNQSLTGHSLWYYISQVYGRDAITEILYLTRVNRSANEGFLFSIGIDQDNLMNEWNSFYAARYQKDDFREKIDSTGTAEKLKVRINGAPSMVRISPDGKYMAYASQDDGAYKVFLLNRETGKAQKLLKAGLKSDTHLEDASYPLIAWSPSGHELLVIYEKKDVLRRLNYTIENEDKEKEDIRGFQRIYSVEYIGPKTLLFSAQKAGQTDIYTHYMPSERTKQITRDFYDDLYATAVTLNGRKGIIFSSNRHTDTIKREKLDSILPVGNLDLFYYDYESKNQVLARLTNTPFSDEKMTQQISEDKYAFISEENGIRNIMEGFMDSVYLGKSEVYYIDGDAYGARNVSDTSLVDSTVLIDKSKWIGINTQLTDLTYNIDEWDVAIKKRQAMVITDKPRTKRQKWYAQIVPVQQLDQAKKPVTDYKKEWSVENAYMIENLVEEGTGALLEEEDLGIDSIYQGPFDYEFQSKYDHILKPVENAAKGSGSYVMGNDIIKTSSSGVRFISSKVIPYRARFTSDMIVTQLDNSTNFTGYESFNLNGGIYNYPDLSALIAYGLTDIMEDHRLVAGFRFPTDFEGSELYAAYSNLKRRLDWRLLFYRKTDKQVFAYPGSDPQPGQLQLPQDVDIPTIYIPPGGLFVQFFGLSGKLKTHYAEASVKYPFDIIRSLRLHAAYRNERIVFQSTDTVGLAFPTYQENWLELKLEYVHDDTKEIFTNIRNGLRFKIWTEFHKNLNQKKSNIYVTAFDLRHYQKIWRNIIWANRVAYGASYGDQKIIYYLGGVDTWLNPKFDNNVPIDYTQNYAFQAPAVNMRGFAQNVRNGNSFLLWNSELRVPIFSAFAKRQIKMAFIRDFQVLAFADAGMAYKGLVPWDDENAFSVYTVGDDSNTPVTVEVNYYRRPTVFGLGTGFRTTVLGYFLRVDVGWGLDGSAVKKEPLWHVSFSKDF
ncbi:MAG: hypothetical protein GY751_22305 [Bacteroidetes bacterium]|nr:hypothetical protein [Bacteroidota bacterium]